MRSGTAGGGREMNSRKHRMTEKWPRPGWDTESGRRKKAYAAQRQGPRKYPVWFPFIRLGLSLSGRVTA